MARILSFTRLPSSWAVTAPPFGGIVVESGRFNWGNGNFPSMTEPVPSYNGVSWWGNFGEFGFLTKLRSEQLRDFGPSLSPQSAFNLLQGVETLPQRMDAHLANAKQVVAWLVEDQRIAYVNYAGLEDHPHHERAKKLLPLGVGSVFSFGVKATERLPAAWSAASSSVLCSWQATWRTLVTPAPWCCTRVQPRTSS